MDITVLQYEKFTYLQTTATMRIRKVTIANMKMASIQSSEVKIFGTMTQVLFHLEQFRYVGSSRNWSLLNNWKSDVLGLMVLYNCAEN